MKGGIIRWKYAKSAKKKLMVVETIFYGKGIIIIYPAGMKNIIIYPAGIKNTERRKTKMKEEDKCEIDCIDCGEYKWCGQREIYGRQRNFSPENGEYE